MIKASGVTAGALLGALSDVAACVVVASTFLINAVKAAKDTVDKAVGPADTGAAKAGAARATTAGAPAAGAATAGAARAATAGTLAAGAATSGAATAATAGAAGERSSN